MREKFTAQGRDQLTMARERKAKRIIADYDKQKGNLSGSDLEKEIRSFKDDKVVMSIFKKDLFPLMHTVDKSALKDLFGWEGDVETTDDKIEYTKDQEAADMMRRRSRQVQQARKGGGAPSARRADLTGLEAGTYKNLPPSDSRKKYYRLQESTLRSPENGSEILRDTKGRVEVGLSTKTSPEANLKAKEKTNDQ